MCGPASSDERSVPSLSVGSAVFCVSEIFLKGFGQFSGLTLCYDFDGPHKYRETNVCVWQSWMLNKGGKTLKFHNNAVNNSK